MIWWCNNNRNKLTLHLYLSLNFSSEENFSCPWQYLVHYQILLCLADLCLKVFGLVVVCVAVCGAQAAEEGGWKLETSGLLLLVWRWFLLPHHLAVWLWMQHTQCASLKVCIFLPHSRFCTCVMDHGFSGRLQTVPGKACLWIRCVLVCEKGYDKHTITTCCSLFLGGVGVKLSFQGLYCWVVIFICKVKTTPISCLSVVYVLEP